MGEDKPENPEKLELSSVDIAAQQKDALRELMPEIFCEDQVDFDALKRVLGEDVENQMAQDLDSNEDIRVFTKLPKWFSIDTPLGPYNPDWAFVTKSEELYFVAETKGSIDAGDLRHSEHQKIRCAEKHFEQLDVNYIKAESLLHILKS